MSYDEKGKGGAAGPGQDQDKLNTELINIIQFSEKVATALCRKMDRAEVLGAVEKEFTGSGKYTGSVLLLAEDRDNLEIAVSSVSSSDKKGFLEKMTGNSLSKYKISLDKSKIYGKVVREAQTLHVKVSDIIDELYPGPIAKLISVTLGYEKEVTILTPIWVRGSVGGVFAMTAPVLAELAVPSVKNLAAYISFALESASQRVEQEKADAEIRKLSAAVEQSIDGIAICDMECALTYVNNAFAGIHGYSPDEMIGMKATDIYSEEQTKNAAGRGGLNELQRCWGEETTHYRKDKTTFTALMSVTLLKDKNGNPIGHLAVIRDITERKTMEEELKKAQKLESLGILAGGIAHNFNNILTVVVGNISLAKMNMRAGEEAYETLSTAEKACLRARGLTQQLLTFSKGDSTIAEPIDIAVLIRDSAVSALNGSGVKCDFSIPDDLYSVSADKGQISQAINNLVINAEQAMPEGGIIRVTAENVELGQGHGLPISSGKYVKTTVKDQGEGIPKENLAKIFDPFFTTRPKGSGLGLSVAFAIVKKHGGHISAESALGDGAAFHVYLPAM